MKRLIVIFLMVFGLMQSALGQSDGYTLKLEQPGQTTVTQSFTTFDSLLAFLRGQAITTNNGALANVTIMHGGQTLFVYFLADCSYVFLSVQNNPAFQKVPLVAPDRLQSLAQFETLLKSDPAFLAFVANPQNPVNTANGTPASTQGIIAASTFDQAFTAQATNIKPAPAEGATTTTGRPGAAGGRVDSALNLFGFGARIGAYRSNGAEGDTIRTTIVSVPLFYTIRPDVDPGRQLTFGIPISYAEVDGQKSYSVSPSVSYRAPITDQWSLNPSVGYSANYSSDLGQATQVLNVSVTSTYIINRDGYDLGIGNMVGYIESHNVFRLGEIPQDVRNTVFRNGLLLSVPAVMFGLPVSVEYSLIDTRFTGTKLYVNGFDEIGVTVGTNRSASSTRAYMRAGLSYLYSPKLKGISLSIGYWF